MYHLAKRCSFCHRRFNDTVPCNTLLKDRKLCLKLCRMLAQLSKWTLRSHPKSRSTKTSRRMRLPVEVARAGCGGALRLIINYRPVSASSDTLAQISNNGHLPACSATSTNGLLIDLVCLDARGPARETKRRSLTK